MTSLHDLEEELVMMLRRLVAAAGAVAVVATGMVLGLAETASAAPAGTRTAAVTGVSGPASAAQRAQDIVRAAVKANPQRGATPARSGSATVVQPALSCPYKYICGKAANGNSFQYARCDYAFTLPNLVGNGPENNNQTPGTTAYFFDQNANQVDPYETSAPDQRTVNWTPIWYVVACVS
jgi:hypothetical protein